MKRILLFVTLFTAIALYEVQAAHERTVLTVQMHNNQPVEVYVNGVRHGGVASQHRLVNLNPGQHNLKVVAISGTTHRRGYGHAPAMGRTIVYNGPVQVIHGFRVGTVIDNFGTLQARQQVAIRRGYGQVPVHHAIGRTMGYGQVQHCSTPVAQPIAPVINHMHPADFDILLNTIANRSFDSTKRQIAANALANNLFTSEQIRLMLQLFSFESNRLEIAQLAYASVVDQQNYYLVYDAFSFESSIRRLETFIYG